MVFTQPNGIPNIIRCRDCMHRGIDTECPMAFTESYYDEDYEEWDYITCDNTTDDGFCDRGEMEE